MDIAQRLRSVRKTLGITRSQAAKLLGLSERTIESWEQGRRTPRGLALRHLEELLDQELKRYEEGPKDEREGGEKQSLKNQRPRNR